MSESARTGEVAQGPQSELALESEHELGAEPAPAKAAVEPPSLMLSAKDFAALEERILRAVEVVRRERHARTEADERAARVEVQLHEKSSQLEQLEKELNALRAERDQVRGRVERLLGQLDALEL